MRRRKIDKQALRALYPPMDEAFESRMRMQLCALAEREERPMKKKLYLIPVAALILALLAASAVAFMISRGFFEDVAQMQLESGYYEQWTLEEKEHMISLMADYGVIDEGDVLAKLARQKGDDAQREEQIDAEMVSRYGRIDAITVDSMLIAQMGGMENWSQEDKVWYSKMMMDAGILGFDTMVDLMPQEGDVTPQAAIDSAKAAVIDAYALDANALDGYTAKWDYSVHRSQYGDKPPYYSITFSAGEGDRAYYADIGGDGRVLTQADGYIGVSSPWENVQAVQAQKEAMQTPVEEAFAEHREALPPLDTTLHVLAMGGQTRLKQLELPDGYTVWQAVDPVQQACYIAQAQPLADGTALICGRAQRAQGIFADCDIQEGVPFAASIDETGKARWIVTFGENKGIVGGGMQRADGDILLLLQRRTQQQEFSFSQVRVSADGEIREELPLRTVQQMTGIRAEYEQIWFEQPGHDGIFISGVAGTANTYFFGQLDERAQDVFTLKFSQENSFTPRMTVLEEGYLLTAYDKAADVPFLRFYDAQGQQTGEDIPIAGLSGMRIANAQEMEDGTLMVRGRMGEDVLGKMGIAQIARDGTVLVTWDSNLSEGFDMRSSIVEQHGRWVYADTHRVRSTDSLSHLGIITLEDGVLTEAYPEGADDIQFSGGGFFLVPIGEGKMALLGSGSLYTTTQEGRTEQLQTVMLVLTP